MTRIAVKLSCGLLTMLVLGCGSARAQNSIGPQGPEEGVIRRQTWLIPAQDMRTLMWTTVFRPPGNGPFPLVVINHGSTQNEIRRAGLRLPEYPALTEWLVARGYAVAVPQRPGHGKTGGTYYEDQGSCAKADFRKAGQGAAGAIAAAAEFMLRQKFIRKDKAVAVGQSAGGWGALALPSIHFRQVSAVVAFAPGLGGRIDDIAGRNCSPGRLNDAAHAFGEKARIPALWLTAENDSYFPPEVSKRLVESYRMGGGKADYHVLPAVGAEGHDMIQAREAVAAWGPIVEKFLKAAR